MKKNLIINEAKALKVMKSHYETSLAAITSRLGDINTELMFAEAEEQENLKEIKDNGARNCKTLLKL